jgi:hypothetical protein
MTMLLPLIDLLREKNSPIRGVDPREFYEAYKMAIGKEPDRDHTRRCLYKVSDLPLVLLKTCCESYVLKELEDWKKMLPLADSLGRKDSLKRLVSTGARGWLSRCSYKHGRLLLCEEDAEQLCYTRKNGFQAAPLRWSLPTVINPR